MTRDELFNIHHVLVDTAFRVMKAKNADYTAGSDDPFANFRNSEMVGVPAELGILVRTVDKIKRIQTFVQHGELAVENESVTDSIIDIINYMVLLQGLIKDRQRVDSAE